MAKKNILFNKDFYKGRIIFYLRHSVYRLYLLQDDFKAKYAEKDAKLKKEIESKKQQEQVTNHIPFYRGVYTVQPWGKRGICPLLKMPLVKFEIVIFCI